MVAFFVAAALSDVVAVVDSAVAVVSHIDDGGDVFVVWLTLLLHCSVGALSVVVAAAVDELGRAVVGAPAIVVHPANDVPAANPSLFLVMLCAMISIFHSNVYFTCRKSPPVWTSFTRRRNTLATTSRITSRTSLSW